jgi:hypothetical protein
MDRAQLLQEAARLSHVVTEGATRVMRQQNLVEVLKTTSNAEELEQAQDSLQAMVEEQTQNESELIRIQAQLLFLT